MFSWFSRTQSYFVVLKTLRLDCTHYFILKNSNKQEVQPIADIHSSDFVFKDFMTLYQKCSAKPYSYLVNDAILASDNPLQFRSNFLEKIQKFIITIDGKIRDKKS